MLDVASKLVEVVRWYASLFSKFTSCQRQPINPNHRIVPILNIVYSVKTTDDAMANIYVLLRQHCLGCPRLEIRKDDFTVILFTFQDAVEV